jgi:hypothetical protein
MLIICMKCNHTMSYDPYFKYYICRQCGNMSEYKEQSKYPFKRKKALQATTACHNK